MARPASWPDGGNPTQASPSAAHMVFVPNAVVRTIALTGNREQKKLLFAI